MRCWKKPSSSYLFQPVPGPPGQELVGRGGSVAIPEVLPSVIRKQSPELTANWQPGGPSGSQALQSQRAPGASRQQLCNAHSQFTDWKLRQRSGPVLKVTEPASGGTETQRRASPPRRLPFAESGLDPGPSAAKSRGRPPVFHPAHLLPRSLPQALPGPPAVSPRREASPRPLSWRSFPSC